MRIAQSCSPWRRAWRFKRVSEDVAVLVELGLIERTAKGGVLCPYRDIEVRMRPQPQARATA